MYLRLEGGNDVGYLMVSLNVNLTDLNLGIGFYEVKLRNMTMEGGIDNIIFISSVHLKLPWYRNNNKSFEHPDSTK